MPKPAHFTNPGHCQECAEHDELLSSRSRETLVMQDVGNPASNPLSFSSPEGMAYYMPSLARLALAEPSHGHGWYGEQLLSILYSGAAYNVFYTYCDTAQKAAIVLLLQEMIVTHAGDIDETCSEDEFLRAHEIWSSATLG